MAKARRLGSAAANNRYRDMAARHDLSEHKQVMLRLTSRLVVHALNASVRILEAGEETQDEKPRELLSKLLELQREIRTNLIYCFDGSGQDEEAAFSKLRGEK